MSGSRVDTMLAVEDSDPENLSDAQERARLDEAVARAAHFLPAQGPISVFVHHNTLHAFENLTFEDAVAAAQELFGHEPYLSEERYRDALAMGRIQRSDLEAVLLDELGESANDLVAGVVDRFGLRMAMLERGIEEPDEAQVEWLAAELAWRTQRRARPGRRDAGGRAAEANEEGRYGERLWLACRAATECLPVRMKPPRVLIRHRDLLLAVTGEDSDQLVNPLLGRLCAAFLDQGVAYWPMPGRQAGFFHAFEYVYGTMSASRRSWLGRAVALVRDQQARKLSAAASVCESLERLGVARNEWPEFLTATLLALRGWAGMMHQLELRPDCAPVGAPPARLVDFLAVRLLLERAALSHVAERRLTEPPDLCELRSVLASRRSARVEPPVLRAFALFQLAHALGLRVDDIVGLGETQVGKLLDEMECFPARERRRLLHEAYERSHATSVLDGLALHARVGDVQAADPYFQAIFCIDEREESIRRHLEEVEPRCETFSTAGYFGVAAYFHEPGQERGVPLCPVAIRPQHRLDEIVCEEHSERGQRAARARAWLAHAAHALSVGSRTFARGALLTAGFGLVAAVPLVLRVLFPRLTAGVRRRAALLLNPPLRTRLNVLCEHGETDRDGLRRGYTLEEMAAIVGERLEEVGLTHVRAPLVFVVGHGSTSLNNPHEAAHDCGACGGGRGGPNARAFAVMANDRAVRKLLAERGITIEPETHFVGALHNTCDESLTLFDVEWIPQELSGAFASARASLLEACRRNAHERCRRFETCSLSASFDDALEHVEERAQDLAQARPEYGHATNAVCVIGRRRRTRGLFLDRRAFLVSYDPDGDDAEGRILARVLAGSLPVVAGINLEYYFSSVDPTGYGSGTKLPHNVCALLGVMDGHASDLRTGLPWQMVEIHEPVRLLVVVEAHPSLVDRVLRANAALDRLVRDRWIRLAALDPASDRIWLHEGGQFRVYRSPAAVLPARTSSLAWYRGHREHLPCARIEAAERLPRSST